MQKIPLKNHILENEFKFVSLFGTEKEEMIENY